MKIGELSQHCGECGLEEYCGNPFGYCICTQERFKDVDMEQYRLIAEKAPTKPYEGCCDCPYEDDCPICAIEDNAKDWYCEQVGDYVYGILQEGR